MLHTIRPPVDSHGGLGSVNTNERFNSMSGHSGVVVVVPSKPIMTAMKGKTCGHGRDTVSNCSINYHDFCRCPSAEGTLASPREATASKRSW